MRKKKFKGKFNEWKRFSPKSVERWGRSLKKSSVKKRIPQLELLVELGTASPQDLRALERLKLEIGAEV